MLNTFHLQTFLAVVEAGPVDELQHARLERLRAQIAFASRRGRDAPPLLLQAARRLDPLDPAMARETYLEAFASAMFAGRLGSGPDECAVAEAARRSKRVPALGAADRLLGALVIRFTEGYAASVAPLSSSQVTSASMRFSNACSSFVRSALAHDSNQPNAPSSHSALGPSTTSVVSRWA